MRLRAMGLLAFRVEMKWSESVLGSMYLNAAGALAAQTRMDVIANNIANADTPGFRRGYAVFQQRASEVWEEPVLEPGWEQPLNKINGGLFVHEVTYSDQQAPIKETGKQFDMAIVGDGWFPVQQGDQINYTRAGNFSRLGDGSIVTASGQAKLLDTNMQPIKLPLDAQQFSVSPAGKIEVDGTTLATIAVRGTLDYRQFTPIGDSQYRYLGEGMPAIADAKIEQGFLERSEVNPVHEMVNLIRTHRAYESNQRMITHQDQTYGRAVNDVGRVG